MCHTVARIPKVAAPVTFRFSMTKGLLLSGGITFEGDNYFRNSPVFVVSELNCIQCILGYYSIVTRRRFCDIINKNMDGKLG